VNGAQQVVADRLYAHAPATTTTEGNVDSSAPGCVYRNIQRLSDELRRRAGPAQAVRAHGGGESAEKGYLEDSKM